MKLRQIIVISLIAGLATTASAQTSLTEIFTTTPEKAGGIYYAYDVESDSVAPAPEGFSPVYISHYGRHGSRWPVNEKIYKDAGDFFQREQLKENISPEGKRVWKLVTLCAGDFRGHRGELTPLGERQHRAIARRMAERYPELFAEGKTVEARSSVEPRCIMSMWAATEGLAEAGAKAEVKRHASPGDMDFIHHKTEASEVMASDMAPWRWDFDTYRDSHTTSKKTAAPLFKTLPDNDSLPIFMRALYDIAISVQDIDSLDAPLLDIFDRDELADQWKAANYMQYVANGRSAAGEYAGIEAVKPLLSDIIERADTALDTGKTSADLRFGHDTDLLRLLALTDINGAGVEAENPEDAARAWRNFEYSPMGANLQLVFYRNGKGDVLVAPRLNERPARISDVPEVSPGFYDWELLKIHFDEQLQ